MSALPAKQLAAIQVEWQPFSVRGVCLPLTAHRSLLDDRDEILIFKVVDRHGQNAVNWIKRKAVFGRNDSVAAG